MPNYSTKEIRDSLFLAARKRGVGDINTVAATIQQVEGYYPGSVSYRNNNPGNLKFANQTGATGADANGFAIFPTYDAGYQALLNQINLDASRGQTIAQFTASYAPAADNNNPTSYAATIANAAGLSVNDSLSSAIGADATGSGNLSVTGDGSNDSGATVGSSVTIAGVDIPTTYLALGVFGVLALFFVMSSD